MGPMETILPSGQCEPRFRQMFAEIGEKDMSLKFVYVVGTVNFAKSLSLFTSDLFFQNVSILREPKLFFAEC